MALKLRQRAFTFITTLVIGIAAWGQPRAADAAPQKPGDVLVVSGPSVFAVDPATRAQTLLLDLNTLTDPDIFASGRPIVPSGVAESRDGIIWLTFRNTLHPYIAPNGVPCSGNCGGVILRLNPDGTHSIVLLGFNLFPEAIAPALDGSVLVTTGGQNPGRLFRVQAVDAATTSVQQFAVPQTLADPGCATPIFAGHQGADALGNPLFDSAGQPVIAIDAAGKQQYDAQNNPIPEYFDPSSGQPIPVYTDPAGLACDFDVVGFKEPRGIAVDPATGNIYVGDIEGGQFVSGSPTLPYCEQFGDCGGLYQLAPGAVIGAQKTLLSDFDDPRKGPLGEDAGSSVALLGNQFVVTDGFWWVAHDLENSANDPCVGSTRPVSCTVLGGVFLVSQNGSRTLLSAYGNAQGQTGQATRQQLPMVVLFDGSILIGGCDRVSGVSTSDSICQVAGPLDPTPGFRTLWSDFGAPLSGVAAMSVVPTQLTKASATTTVVASPNPSIYGQLVTLTATVVGSGGTPTGQVTFFDGASPLAPSPTLAAGMANISTAALTTGSHTITASYSGDAAFASGASSGVTLVVNQAQTTTSLSSTLPVATFGDSIVLTAVVSPQFGGLPTGTVNFFDGATLLGSQVLDPTGTALITVTSLGAGPHTVTATYAGDANFLGSSGSTSETVNPVGSTVVAVATPQPADVGSPVTLTAFITLLFGPTPPTGAVVFTIDGTDTAPVVVAGGKASYVANGLTIGTHTVVATYQPNTPNILGATSRAITVVVQPIPTATVLVASPNPATFGQLVTLTAVITASQAPTGTVTFDDNFVPLGPPIPLAPGTNQVQLQLSTFAVGVHALRAQFTGSPATFANSLGTAALTVNPASTTTTLTVTPTTSTSGQIVTLQATVASPTVPSVTGAVTFTADGVNLGTVALAANQATYTTELLGIGTHSLTAMFNGSSSLAASTSAPTSETVNYAVTSPARSASPQPKMDYYGGPVISNVDVHAVFWGSGVDPTVQAQIGSFFTQIVNSPYLDLLSEYSTAGKVATAGLNAGQPGSNQVIGRGTYAGAVTITPSICNVPPCLIYNDQLQAELNRQIALGTLPAPTYDAAGHPNTVFMLYFPPGVTIDIGTQASPGGTSCSTFLGYHGTGALPGGQDLLYGVVPDQTACEIAPYREPTSFDEVTQVTSHELAEVITDASAMKVTARPFGAPMAWYSEQQSVTPYYYTTDYGEIADVCNGIAGTVNGFSVQLIWSNQQNLCVLAPAAAPATVTVSVAATPAGPSFTVDGVTYTTPQTFTWNIGTTHTLDTASPQAGGTGTRFIWTGWSDAGVMSHTVTASAATTAYTASFRTEYQLTTSTSPTAGGTVTPASGQFYASGAVVNVSATASPTYTFANWTGNVANASAASTTVTMSAPETIAANFSPAAPVLQSIAVAPANPSIAAGLTQAFTATGTYSDGSTKDLTGSVTWTSATPAVATIAAGGVATAAAVGASTIRATAGAISGSTMLTVTRAPTSSALASSANPSRAGQTITVTATVSGYGPTGSVTFTVDGVSLAPIALIGGAAAMPLQGLTAGTHAIVAAYGGDTNNLPSTSPALPQVVTAGSGKAPTQTTLVTSGSPSNAGQPVTFTATVSGASPTGTVTFVDSKGNLGTAPVVNGVATLTVSSLSKGAHQVSAAYSGDAANLPSTSAKVKQQVQ